METREFVYDAAASKIRVTNAQMIEDLQAFARTTGGRAFRISDFHSWPSRCCATQSICRRFGGWRAALEAAGIQGARGWNYPPEDLIAHLAQVWRKLERPPGVKALERAGHFSAMTYARRWGSLANACTQFALYKKGDITLEQLLYPPPPPRKDRSPLPKSLRWQILERDHHRCTACGKSAADNIKLEVDHITPVNAGGSNNPTNLRTLCQPCNRGKGGKRNRPRSL